MWVLYKERLSVTFRGQKKTTVSMPQSCFPLFIYVSVYGCFYSVLIPEGTALVIVWASLSLHSHKFQISLFYANLEFHRSFLHRGGSEFKHEINEHEKIAERLTSATRVGFFLPQNEEDVDRLKNKFTTKRKLMWKMHFWQPQWLHSPGSCNDGVVIVVQ